MRRWIWMLPTAGLLWATGCEPADPATWAQSLQDFAVEFARQALAAAVL